MVVDMESFNQARSIIRLSPEQSRHVESVLRLKVGDPIRVGLVRGPTFIATIESLRTRDVRVRVPAELPGELPQKPSLSLIVALPRPKAIPRLVEDAASFGIDHLDLINAWRVEKSYWASGKLSPDTLEHAALMGCQQGGHTWKPTITLHRYFADFIRGFAGAGTRWILHPGSSGHLSLSSEAQGTHVFAIGPEGGFIEAELSAFEAEGFRPVRLGPSTLRTEVALNSALGQWDLLRLNQGSV